MPHARLRGTGNVRRMPPMSEPPSRRPPTVRLRAPADVVESVPYLLGFHPSDSLVLLSLRRDNLGLCMRADLPGPGDVSALAGYAASKMREDGADAAVLVVYGPDAEQVRDTDAGGEAGSRPSRRDLVEACCGLLVESGIDVRDALQVADGRWWSYLCIEPGCCPAEGTPVAAPGSGRSAAAWAFAGRVALPDRDALVAGLEPPRGTRARELKRLIRRVRAEDRRASADGLDAAYAHACVAMFRDAVEACEHPRGQVDEERAVRLGLALSDTDLRDEVMLWAVGSRKEALMRLLGGVLACLPPPQDVAAATTYAWVAYQRGDGVLARAALDRALASDPVYSLAVLLADALDSGLHPSVLAEVGVRARLDRHRQGLESR